jgi:hypothetical protein
MVLIKGFTELAEEFGNAYKSSDDPIQKLRAILHAYVNWGIANKHYYNIMFSMDTPKYSDYRGTAMELVAERQNLIALEISEIGKKILAEVAQQKKSITVEEVPYRLLYLWSILHGMVSLYISRVTLEVWDLKGAMERILDDIIRPYDLP